VFEGPVDKVPIISLELFGIRQRSEKNSPEQYCRDLSKSIKQWCGIETKVVSKKVQLNNERNYQYTFKYNPSNQFFEYVQRPIDIFKDNYYIIQ